MPCRDYEPNSSEMSQLNRINRQSEKLDHLTALLCKASQMLIKAQPTSSEAQEIYAWYEAHREADVQNMRELLKVASDLNPEFFIERVSIEEFDKLDEILCKILELR
jgi:hypothetical protein